MQYDDIITQCDDKVREAEAAAYEARCEAIDTILEGAPACDTMLLLSWFLGRIVAESCDEHRAAIRADIIGLLDAATSHHDERRAECDAENEAGEATKH